MVLQPAGYLANALVTIAPPPRLRPFAARALDAIRKRTEAPFR
jgi:hypothetical protein